MIYMKYNKLDVFLAHGEVQILIEYGIFKYKV